MRNGSFRSQSSGSTSALKEDTRVRSYNSIAHLELIANASSDESLLVLRGLGIQTTSSSSSYLSTSSTRFIPTTSIQDIFIHEAFKGLEVRFYLAIVVEGESEVVVVFPVGFADSQYGCEAEANVFITETSTIPKHH